MLHVQSSADSDELSPPLPKNMDLELRLLLTRDPPNGGLIDKAALERLPTREPQDSNEVEIGRFHGTDIVADGREVLKQVLKGLERRLAHPIVLGEKLRVVGATGHDPA
ncbi:hypothetical protein POL68_29000 [Stigmatella sp. ncwal1]|uniref:Uncharacterized protein n=1 Tax=Stigmatella ashevillensis TaxID=2995309 RepID=A0ABT5DG91_9BACT|nr:hypothetical protein [Stigmatella ashevillena]MDC0712536.1 hypothetical protein [Stigmatella ashevillena]